MAVTTVADGLAELAEPGADAVRSGPPVRPTAQPTSVATTKTGTVKARIGDFAITTSYTAGPIWVPPQGQAPAIRVSSLRES